MRDLYKLAATLGTTVATLLPQLSAQEFARWQAWMQAEQVGPEWAAHRHAEAMAAAYNAGQFKHRDARAFAAADFARPDPWAEAAPALTPEQERARVQADLADLQRQMDV
jgi:hypothetical protein